MLGVGKKHRRNVNFLIWLVEMPFRIIQSTSFWKVVFRYSMREHECHASVRQFFYVLRGTSCLCIHNIVYILNYMNLSEELSCKKEKVPTAWPLV
eukprot:TRINITY_DN80_c0_g1_i8.p2 TRINITY_DN80_c0_g1~~TRINITY_DN80_c0_g1_i8.p2  ORF type:complete len:95 (+),score=13.66 TRINITY_DN80_c0_g1_i8:252-536(+)